MTSAAPLSPESVLEALRGDRHHRPPLDTTSAAHLREQIERGAADLLGEVVPELPLVVSARSARASTNVTDLHDSARGRLRGALISVALRLHVVGAELSRPFDDALAAWLADGPAPDDAAFARSLEGDDRARLATEVTAHYVTLMRSLGQVPPEWSARSAQRAILALAGGRVLVRDTVDLVIGSVHGASASVVLLDVMTSPLGEDAERTLRFHALVETLRSSAVPLRSAVLSTATGELWLREVDPEMLARAASELLDSLRHLWGLR